MLSLLKILTFRERVYRKYKQIITKFLLDYSDKFLSNSNNLVFTRDNFPRGTFWKSSSQKLPGVTGDNISIAILHYKRLESTLALLSTIPFEFSGEILILNQGSDQEDFSNLSKFKHASASIRIFNSPENLGVAKGRNYLIQESRKQWIMSLDNDAAFTGNPFPHIQKLIENYGLHFMNLTFSSDTGFYNVGSKFWMNNKDKLGVTSALPLNYEGRECNFVSDFLLGGGSVFNKESFEGVGKFNEDFFIGFEDLEFSVRLFQKGYMVLNTTKSFMKHVHPIAKNKKSKEYESTRFSRRHILNSAEKFHEIHGIEVWSHEDELWLQQQKKRQGINE